MTASRQALCEGRSQRRGEFMLGCAVVCFAARTLDEWAAFAGEVDCCLEPGCCTRPGTRPPRSRT